MMTPSIFITGAGGFVGRELLAAIDPSRFEKIICFDRNSDSLTAVPGLLKNAVPVFADLLDPSGYEAALQGVDTVIHLAALTGKAHPKDYFRINDEGTRLLLLACERAGVRNFLLVSSIAAKFENTNRYYYAQSKQLAEDAVKKSGLRYTILRPTMIFGEGSPIESAFSRFARLPVVPLFGGGKTLVQPVHVRDVARIISAILTDDRFDGETYEVGGSTVVSIKELFSRIRERETGSGSTSFRSVSIPVGFTAAMLTLAEPLLYRVLPITVGQLATFRNDGRAVDHPHLGKLLPTPTPLDEMMPAGSGSSPAVTGATHVDRECAVFCRYLINQKPDGYVQKKYAECSRRMNFKPVDRFDVFLLKWASKGPRLCKCCDAYSRFFRSRTPLRKKLIYLLAILETSPRFHPYIDIADEKNRWLLFAQVGFRGGIFMLTLLFSSIFLIPAQVLLGGKAPKGGEGVSDG